MDFGFTQEQEMLRRTARELLDRECGTLYARRMMEDERGVSEDVWRTMAGLGWHGLVIPQEHGGAGLGMVELVVLLEEMGRVVLPGPFFSTVVLGGYAVLLGGSAEQRERYLPQIAAGDLRVTLADLEESGRWDEEGIALTATPDDSGFRLEGTKLFVLDGHTADLLVVAARADTAGASRVSLFLVDRQSPGIEVRPLKTVDQTRRLSEVVFRGCWVGADRILGREGGGWNLLQRLTDLARVALCAEMCGGAERVLEMTVEYAKVREQFGRPIGSFQAIQHKCANMLLQVESAKSATYYAAWAVANEIPEAHLAACTAKACVSDAYRAVAAEGIQVHGGIGFTWEHDLHLYFKRATTSEVAFGDACWNRELVARVLLDGQGAV